MVIPNTTTQIRNSRTTHSFRGKESATKVAVIQLFLEHQTPLSTSFLFEKIAAQTRITSKRSFKKHLSYLKKARVLNYDFEKRVYSLPADFWRSSDYLKLVAKHVLGGDNDKILDLEVSLMPETVESALKNAIKKHKRGESPEKRAVEYLAESAKRNRWNFGLFDFYVDTDIQRFNALNRKKKNQIITERNANSLLECISHFDNGKADKADIQNAIKDGRFFLNNNKLSKEQISIIEYLIHALEERFPYAKDIVEQEGDAQ